MPARRLNGNLSGRPLAEKRHNAGVVATLAEKKLEKAATRNRQLTNDT